jgi:hypothetical protein
MPTKPSLDNDDAAAAATMPPTRPTPPNKQRHQLRSAGLPAPSAQYTRGPHVPPPSPTPDETSTSLVDEASPPLLSRPDDDGFQVVKEGKRPPSSSSPATPTSPPTFGTRFDVLADTEERPVSPPAATSAQALWKAIRAEHPSIYALF